MRNATLYAILTVAAVALAGCADDATKPTPTTGGTPATSTPATSTPAATTPVNVTPTTPTPPTGEPHEMPECPAPATTDAAPGNNSGYPEITFTVQEPTEDNPCYSFVGPASVAAGWTAVTLRDTGMEPHIMPMFRITDDEKDLDDVKEILMSENASEPEWLVPVGGVGVATPFSQGTVILNLTEGRYVLVCFFNGHHVQGMVRQLNVTAADGEALPEPTADVTVTMHNFGYNLSDNVTAGKRIVRFVNEGTQPHEAPLIALTGNATMQDFLAAIENPQGPPPGAGVGGVNVILPGGVAYGVVDFMAGTYGLVCFVEDDESHQPHFLLGMVHEFEVAEA